MEKKQSWRHYGAVSTKCRCQKVHDDETNAGLRLKILTLLGNRCSNPDCRWQNPDGTLGCADSKLLWIVHRLGETPATLARRRVSLQGRVFPVKQDKYYAYVFARVKEGSTDYQTLCGNCKRIKSLETKEEWATEFYDWCRAEASKQKSSL